MHIAQIHTYSIYTYQFFYNAVIHKYWIAYFDILRELYLGGLLILEYCSLMPPRGTS